MVWPVLRWEYKTQNRNKWAGAFPQGERKPGEEGWCAGSSWGAPGCRAATAPPRSANRSLHEQACFPNASFTRHIFHLAFVKSLLLWTCWQELTRQLLKWSRVRSPFLDGNMRSASYSPSQHISSSALTSTWLPLPEMKKMLDVLETEQVWLFYHNSPSQK